MNAKKNWCWKCGKVLNKKYINMHYDPLTGEQEFDILWKCPDYKPYHILWGHTKFTSDEDGNTYTYGI